MSKLLILGGAGVHAKLVSAAKRLGHHVIVVDNLPVSMSPAKKIADENYRIDIKDIDSLVLLCKKELVQGCLSTHLDPCQIPYVKLCDAMNYPCLADRNAIRYFTNKKVFKRLCKDYKLDVTEEYISVDEISEYPVFIKPSDSRGSRGQYKCNNRKDIINAISKAEQESEINEYLIERYYSYLPEIQVTYYFSCGKCYLVRTADSYKGKGFLDNVIMYGVSPSVYTEEYLRTVNYRIVAMLKAIGIRNGPVMVQGFFSNEKFYIFDQGLRFPGVDYEKCFTKVWKVDLLEPLIEFALSGIMNDISLDENSAMLKGMQFRTIFPLLKTGRIAEIKGVSRIENSENVLSFLARKKVGDRIGETNDINRRFAEIDILADEAEISSIEKGIRKHLSVVDDNGREMIMNWRDGLW